MCVVRSRAFELGLISSSVRFFKEYIITDTKTGKYSRKSAQELLLQGNSHGMSISSALTIYRAFAHNQFTGFVAALDMPPLESTANPTAFASWM